MTKVLFVCHGNICRSTMAEFYMKHIVNEAGLSDSIYIESAATSREEIGNDTHYGTKQKLDDMGIPYTRRKARQVTVDDYLIIMDENNARNLRRIIGDDVDHKVHKAMTFVGESRDVKDTWYTGNLDDSYDDVSRSCDALFQIMGAESFIKNSEKGLIEVAPLAYMRGRTLDNAFIILDEAQNTTPAQMKMFLTRIGFGSKVVITGDSTQKDLPAGQTSGLDVAVSVVKNLEDISICRLTSRVVVRHPLVQRIVKAYEEYEQKQEQKKSHTRDRKKRGTR